MILFHKLNKFIKIKLVNLCKKKQIPNLVQETVLTLQKDQDENDVKNLFKKLKSKFGGHELLEISVHRDEGHFQKDGIAYYLTKNMLKKNNEYFIKSNIDTKNFDKKIDINTFEKIYNYHAHAKFSMFDKELGKTARMQKRDMSNRIKFVSEELGLKFAPDKSTSKIHKSVHQIKDEHKSKAVQQEKDNYNFREMQKKITALENASIQDKKELHKLNSQVKNSKIDKDILEKSINALKKQNNVLLEELVEKTHKINPTQDLTLLSKENEELKTENLELKKENSSLSKVISIIRDFTQEHSKGFNKLLDKIKKVFEKNKEHKQKTEIEKIVAGMKAKQKRENDYER